jgi:hypothetical protein
LAEQVLTRSAIPEQSVMSGVRPSLGRLSLKALFSLHSSMEASRDSQSSERLAPMERIKVSQKKNFLIFLKFLLPLTIVLLE